MSASATPIPSDGSTDTSKTARAPRRTGKPEHMNGPLYRQANSNVVLVRRPKRKGEGPLKQLTRWFVNNQIGALRFPVL